MLKRREGSGCFGWEVVEGSCSGLDVGEFGSEAGNTVGMGDLAMRNQLWPTTDLGFHWA